MAAPIALRALGPVWFRFTDPEDMGKYGDGWYRYNESEILRKRARDLIELETALGLPLVAIMNGFRESTVLGDSGAAWIAVHEADPALAGTFDEFNPITMLIEWSKAAPEPEGKDEPPVSTPEPVVSTYTTGSSLESTNSGKTDTVALQTLPIEGS